MFQGWIEREMRDEWKTETVLFAFYKPQAPTSSFQTERKRIRSWRWYIVRIEGRRPSQG